MMLSYIISEQHAPKLVNTMTKTFIVIYAAIFFLIREKMDGYDRFI